MTNFEMAMRLAGMNGQELAEITGTGRSYISQLVTGARNLGKNNVAEYAKALDVDQAWLMGYPGQLPVWDPLARKTLTCQIVRTEDISDYGCLYIVHHPETGSTFGVIVSQGDQLTLTDWQGRCPRDASEIQDYTWMDQLGHNCVMMDGLPRVAPLSPAAPVDERKEQKAQFEAGTDFDGSAINYILSLPDRDIYAAVKVPDDASEDYGYFPLKEAAEKLAAEHNIKLVPWYSPASERHLSPDAWEGEPVVEWRGEE